MPDRDARPAEIRRVSYAEHAARAVAGHPDRDAAGAIARDAVRLDPLQRIQVATDQLARQAEDRLAGRPWDFPLPFQAHARDTLAHVGRLRDVLRCAADAADSMIAEMRDQLTRLEPSMSADDPTKDDQLTTSGAPHPLNEGGYDPDSDPGLPGNISDVEALKEGKMTRKQAEALAAADAEAAEEQGREPAASEGRDAPRGDTGMDLGPVPSTATTPTPTPPPVTPTPTPTPPPAPAKATPLPDPAKPKAPDGKGRK